MLQTGLLSVIVASWLVSLNACSVKLPESVILPDNELLRPAVACEWDVNSDLPPTKCTYDPTRVNIDLGYLRTLVDELSESRKARF